MREPAILTPSHSAQVIPGELHDKLQFKQRKLQTHDPGGSHLHGGDGGEDVHIRFAHPLLPLKTVVQVKCLTSCPDPE